MVLWIKKKATDGKRGQLIGLFFSCIKFIARKEGENDEQSATHSR